MTSKHLMASLVSQLKAQPVEEMNLDKAIAHLVPLFNRLPGIATRSSCSAHPPKDTKGWILFYVEDLSKAQDVLGDIVMDAFSVLNIDEPNSLHQIELRVAPMNVLSMECKEGDDYELAPSIEFVVYDEIMRTDYINALGSALVGYLEEHNL